MPLITSLNVDVHINSLIPEAQEPVTNGKELLCDGIYLEFPKESNA